VPETTDTPTAGPAVSVNRLTRRRRSLVALGTRAATTVSTLDAQIDEIDRQLAHVFTGPSRPASVSAAPIRRPKAGPGRAHPTANGPTGSARPNPTADKILSTLRRTRAAKGMSPSEIAHATDINKALASKTLQRLVDRGRVEHVTRGRYRVPR